MDSNTEKLAQSIHSDGLNLFLGAGVSVSAGLPSWEKLTDLMIDLAWPDLRSPWNIQNTVMASVIRQSGPVEAMRLVRQELGKSFLEKLRSALYADYRSPSTLLEVIAKLACVRFICSYNFDDLLEQALAFNKRHFTILTPGDRLPSESHSLAIAHPHGFLPMFSDPGQVPKVLWNAYVEIILDKATGDVVITEDDYHVLYRDPVGWSNLVQIRALLARPSLFVGCSLADPNVRRLLSVTKAISPYPHCAVFLHPFSSIPDQTGWAGMVRDPLERAKTKVYEATGVTPLWIRSFDELPGLLKYLDNSLLSTQTAP